MLTFSDVPIQALMELQGNHSQEAPVGHSVNLPPEVWREVACHLSFRQWVRVSGICRLIWKLQLDEFDVDIESVGLPGEPCMRMISPYMLLSFSRCPFLPRCNL